MLIRGPIKKVLRKNNKPLANIVRLRALTSKVSATYHFFGCTLPSEAASN